MSLSLNMYSNKKYPPNSMCKCDSNKKYKKCCKVYHDGSNPSKALDLMKSRFTAYALGNSDYIINTTHKNNSEYTDDVSQWKSSIEEFSNSVEFRSLEIIEFIDEINGSAESFVTFKANIFQENNDLSFTEKSRFSKHDNKWLYVDGTFL